MMKKAVLALLLATISAFPHYAVLSAPLVKFKLDQIKNDLRVEEALKQQRLFRGRVTAERAAFLAIKSFLNDPTHIESPLAIATDLALDELDLTWKDSNNPTVVKRAKAILFEHLNQYSSEIGWVYVGETAEHGESVEQNWIISLKIPTLSDHLYWAIVNRKGLKPTYNYGFN